MEHSTFDSEVGIVADKSANDLHNLPGINLNKKIKLKSIKEKKIRFSTDHKEDEATENRSTYDDSLSNVEEPMNKFSDCDKSEGNLESLTISLSSSSDDETDDDGDIQDEDGNIGTGAKKNPSEFLGFISNIPITLSAKTKRRLKRNSSILYCDDENSDCDIHSSHSFESPRKRLKIPEKPTEKTEFHKSILRWKNAKLEKAREDFNSHLVERFFLENNGQVMDYQNWLKKPSWDLLHYIKNNKLPGDESLLKKFDGCKFYHYYNSKIEKKFNYNNNLPEIDDEKSGSSPTKLNAKNVPQNKKSNSPSKHLTEKNIHKKAFKQKNILSLIGRLATPRDGGSLELETLHNEIMTAQPRESSLTKDTVQISDDQNLSDSDCEILSESLMEPSSSDHYLQNQTKKSHSRRRPSDRDVNNTDYGRLVWAKLKGYCPFPAMIVNPYECGMKEQNDRVCVFWMGDTRVSQIPLADVKDFVKNFKNKHLKSIDPLYRAAIMHILKECCRRANVKIEESICITNKIKLLKVGGREPPEPTYHALVRWASLDFSQYTKLYAHSTDCCPYPPDIESWLEEISRVREEDKSNTGKDKSEDSFSTEEVAEEMQGNAQTTQNHEKENEETGFISRTGRVIKSKKYSDYAYNEQDIVAVNSKGKKSKEIKQKNTSDADSDTGFYEVEKILNHRMGIKGLELLVKWIGFDEENSTWEPKTNLLGCITMLNEYLENIQKKKRVQKTQFFQKENRVQKAQHPQQQKQWSETTSEVINEGDEEFDDFQQLLEPEMILEEEGVRVEPQGNLEDPDVQFVDMSQSDSTSPKTSHKNSQRRLVEQNVSSTFEEDASEPLLSSFFIDGIRQDGLDKLGQTNTGDDVCRQPSTTPTAPSSAKVHARTIAQPLIPGFSSMRMVHYPGGKKVYYPGAKKSSFIMIDKNKINDYLKNTSDSSKKVFMSIRTTPRNESMKYVKIAPKGSEQLKSINITNWDPSKPRTIIPIENLQSLLGNDGKTKVSSTSIESIVNISDNNENVSKTINTYAQSKKKSQENVSNVKKIIINRNMESECVNKIVLNRNMESECEVIVGGNNEMSKSSQPSLTGTRIQDPTTYMTTELSEEDPNTYMTTDLSEEDPNTYMTTEINEEDPNNYMNTDLSEEDNIEVIDNPLHTKVSTKQSTKSSTTKYMSDALQINITEEDGNEDLKLQNTHKYSPINAKENSNSDRINIGEICIQNGEICLQNVVDKIIHPDSDKQTIEKKNPNKTGNNFTTNVSEITSTPSSNAPAVIQISTAASQTGIQKCAKNISTLLNFTFNYDHFPSERNMLILAKRTRIKIHSLQNWFSKKRQPLQIIEDAPLLYCKYCDISLPDRIHGQKHLYDWDHFLKIIGPKFLNDYQDETGIDGSSSFKYPNLSPIRVPQQKTVNNNMLSLKMLIIRAIAKVNGKVKLSKICEWIDLNYKIRTLKYTRSRQLVFRTLCDRPELFLPSSDNWKLLIPLLNDPQNECYQAAIELLKNFPEIASKVYSKDCADTDNIQKQKNYIDVNENYLDFIEWKIIVKNKITSASSKASSRNIVKEFVDLEKVKEEGVEAETTEVLNVNPVNENNLGSSVTNDTEVLNACRKQKLLDDAHSDLLLQPSVVDEMEDLGVNSKQRRKKSLNTVKNSQQSLQEEVGISDNINESLEEEVIVYENREENSEEEICVDGNTEDSHFVKNEIFQNMSAGSHNVELLSSNDKPRDRERHNTLEKMRRIDLGNAFEYLRECVPELSSCLNPPKHVIIKKAADYCKFITKQEITKKLEIEQLTRCQHELKRKKAALGQEFNTTLELKNIFNSLNVCDMNNPYYSTEYLILQAIVNSKKQKLMENQITEWIRFCFPYYKKVKNLTTKISEELTRNTCFTQKVEGQNKYWSMSVEENFPGVSTIFVNKKKTSEQIKRPQLNSEHVDNIPNNETTLFLPKNSEQNQSSEVSTQNSRAIHSSEDLDPKALSLNTKKSFSTETPHEGLNNSTSTGIQSYHHFVSSLQSNANKDKTLPNVPSSLLCQNVSSNVSAAFNIDGSPGVSIPGIEGNSGVSIPESYNLSKSEGILITSEAASKQTTLGASRTITSKPRIASPINTTVVIPEDSTFKEDSKVTNVFHAKNTNDPNTTHKYFIRTKVHDDGKTYQYLYREDGTTNKLIGFKELTEPNVTTTNMNIEQL